MLFKNRDSHKIKIKKNLSSKIDFIKFSTPIILIFNNDVSITNKKNSNKVMFIELKLILILFFIRKKKPNIRKINTFKFTTKLPTINETGIK